MSSRRDNRAPTTVWSLYRPGTSSNNGYVRTADHDRIEVCRGLGDGTMDVTTWTRSEARLLARRINECLDHTVKT